jgi:heme oxygenase
MRLLLLPILSAFLFSQDGDSTDFELDLDAMWENTVWEEIQDVVSVGYEVEKITAVAGVRGAEAEDEALNHLYYRKSMKGLSELQLRKALGKLLNKRSKLQKEGTAVPEEIDKYILVLRNKIKISK